MPTDTSNRTRPLLIHLAPNILHLHTFKIFSSTLRGTSYFVFNGSYQRDTTLERFFHVQFKFIEYGQYGAGGIGVKLAS